MTKLSKVYKVFFFSLILCLFIVGDSSFAVVKTANLVGAWRFEGNANDWSGNANNGTVTGATLAAGKFGQCYSFDGVDDYINNGSGATLDVAGSAFSLSLWVKLAGQPASGKIMNFFSKAAINYSGSGYGFGYDNRNGTPGFNLYKAGVIDQKVVTTLSNDVWYNLVVVQSYSGGAPSSVTYYVNGSSVGTFNHTGAYQDSSGQISYTGGYSTYESSVFTNGLIDEVRIFNRALNEAEIRALMLNYDPGEF